MGKEAASISDAELELMKVLWRANSPQTVQQVSDALKGHAWKYSTIATLFSRLVEKGAVTYEKKGRFYYYTPLLSEDAYKAAQTRSFISRLYDGSVKNLVVSLFENRQMSEQDIAEIKEKFKL